MTFLYEVTNLSPVEVHDDRASKSQQYNLSIFVSKGDHSPLYLVYHDPMAAVTVHATLVLKGSGQP